MKKISNLAFLTVAVLLLIAIVLEIEVLQFICKPLITLTLAIFYRSAVDQEHRSPAVMLALLFSFIGDVLLMLQGRGELYFMLGLGSFLFAQMFYIFSYRQHRNPAQADALQGVQRMRLAFPILLAGTGLIVILYPVLGELKIPVLLYSSVLVLMVLHALFRFGRTGVQSFWLVFGGALLFMISDSMIAIHKFLTPIPAPGLLIMSTYMMAQYLIITGLIRHKPQS